MSAITDLDDLVKILAETGNTETKFWVKTINSYSGGTLQQYTLPARLFLDFWLFDGTPSRGQSPTTAAICTNTTTGGLMQSATTTNKEKFLIQHGVAGWVEGTMILYDRLVHAGGISANTTTVQTINTPQLTRYSGASSVGNRILIELFESITGSTQRTIGVTYTNQDGVSGRVGYATVAGTNELTLSGTCQFVTLVSGDTGVRSIESVQLNNTADTQPRNIGIAIIRPLSMVPIIFGNQTRYALGGINDFVLGLPGIPKIESTACLAYIFEIAKDGASTSFYGDFTAMLTMVEK